MRRAPSVDTLLGVSMVVAGCGGTPSGDLADTSGGDTTASSSSGLAESGLSAASSSSSGAADGESTGGPEPSDRISPTCEVAGVLGKCRNEWECLSFESAFSGLCGGALPAQCCIPVTPACSRLGAPGLCIPADQCTAPLDAVSGLDEQQQFELCPNSSDVCCTDPLGRCSPETMPLPNEGLVEEHWDDLCPDGMLSIDLPWTNLYCIDKYEASVVVVDDEGQGVQSWSPYHPPPEQGIRAVSTALSVPQGFISFEQAVLACETSGKRLCTGAEWEFACAGEEFWPYPYGSNYSPSVCNERRAVPPAVEYFGTEASWVWEETANACLSQLPESLDRTGQNQGCVTRAAVFDLVGNVAEWTTSGALVGGSFSDPFQQQPSCYSARFVSEDQRTRYSAGFRCCAEPE